MSLLAMSNRYQLDGQVRDDVRLSTQILERGNDHTVSFEGTSQFTTQGVSACGLAAFNFARIAFRIEQNSKNVADILNELSTRNIIEEIVAICAGWSNDMHLEADDIHNLPIFSRSLKLASIEYGRPRPRHFQHLLQNMKSIEKSAVMIITRPPEIIACFKSANSKTEGRLDASKNPVFVVFDSHTRPSHPHGAGLSFSTSIESTARTLSDALPTMDEGMFDSSDFQWQAQLLANCSAHVYVARHRRKDHEVAIVRSSLAILDLRAQISELRGENRKLDSDKRELQLEADRLRVSIRQEQAKGKQEAPMSLATFGSSMLGRSFGLISHAVAGPSRTSGTYNRSIDTPITPIKRAPPVQLSSDSSATGAQSIFAQNPPPVPSATPSGYEALGFENDFSTGADKDWIQSLNLAQQLQDEFDGEDWQLREEQARLARQLKNKFDSEDRRRQDYTRLAFQLQNEYNAEDQQLRQEQAELARYVQATFQCTICLDELPEDDVAEMDDCAHMMCRPCLRGFISSKIQEHRYPIFCPMCTIDTKNKEPSVISRFLIEQLGVSEEQFQILIEMELAEFTVQIHCRKCRRPSSVDREDYSDALNIVCPQSDCNHVWCKKCEQTIVIDGPKHSCDGSSELDHLMKEKGWKHCPNCTTPILKEVGCNHMTCISPGCNTHFCYICGRMIVRSALNHEIEQAVSAHFRLCQLFEVPD